jgi:hypothetical protein
MSALLAVITILGLLPEVFLNGTTRDDVYIELIKLGGILVSALASSFALWIANKNRKTTKRVETKVDRKRKSVRRTDSPGDDPTVTIVEDRRAPKR